MRTTKTMLMILDGWGISPDPAVSAIDQAKTPVMDRLAQEYPTAQLLTHGGHVGLPDGQMGNSEVGHMNLGAGRIVYQDLAKINKDIAEGALGSRPVVQEIKTASKRLHLIGLLSDGGVHSHINHLFALMDEYAGDNQEVFVHAFTDGRDVDPHSGAQFLERLAAHCAKTGAKLASVVGRYYAMDRDNRWERVARAYDLLVHGRGTPSQNSAASVRASYQDGTTDEFILPIVMQEDGRPVGTIQDGDAVLFTNFRTDRGRQLVSALTQMPYPDYNMKPLDIKMFTMTVYDETFQQVSAIYTKDNLNQTLGEVLSRAGKTQIRIAETEKYPHVTFFFNGGREEPFDGERRLLCASPKVATYDLQPEMSAGEITDTILPEIEEGNTDFICLNFANTDMVGHTGDFKAAIQAAEFVDTCVGRIVEAALDQDYSILIIADHGNADCMINADGSTNTAHTTNPVPLIVVSNQKVQVKDGVLGDVAPSILKLMGVVKPLEMSCEGII